jgi:hypothetical protein
MMNTFFDPQGKPPITEADKQHMDRLRSQFQSTLAACVTVLAETKLAQQIARVTAGESIALFVFSLRLIGSPEFRAIVCL